MKNIILFLFTFALVISGSFALAPQNVEASCGWNGYMHSEGKCDKSHKWEGKKWKYEDDYDDYEDDDDEDEDEDEEDDDNRQNRHKPLYLYNNDALEVYINQLLAFIERLKEIQGESDIRGDIYVTTQSATAIDENSAMLRARVNMNDEEEGELFFEYGTSYGNLNKDSDTITLDEGDDEETLEEEISGLEDDTRYYFRAVVEDQNGDKRYGATLSFITDDNSENNNNTPEATTLSAQEVDTDRANLRGEVDMNDYENGKAFFVYGEEKSLVDSVEDDFDTYSEVDEDGDDLRKVEVDGDVDNTENYTKEVVELDENIDIYFAMCVEYDDEDDDETLICGAVKSFETK